MCDEEVGFVEFNVGRCRELLNVMDFMLEKQSVEIEYGVKPNKLMRKDNKIYLTQCDINNILLR